MKKIFAILVFAFLASFISLRAGLPNPDCKDCPLPCPGCDEWSDNEQGIVTANFYCEPTLVPDATSTYCIGNFFSSFTGDLPADCQKTFTWWLWGPKQAAYTCTCYLPQAMVGNTATLEGVWKYQWDGAPAKIIGAQGTESWDNGWLWIDCQGTVGGKALKIWWQSTKLNANNTVGPKAWTIKCSATATL